jgi:hypothetical protein
MVEEARTRYRVRAIARAPWSSLMRRPVLARARRWMLDGLAEVVEAVVLAAECDLLLDCRDGNLVAGFDDLDRDW